MLISVTNTLAFIGFWRAICSYLGRDFTNLLLITSLNKNLCLTRSLYNYSCRNTKLYWMRKAQRKIKLLTLRLCTITDTNQLQFLFKALTNANYHIV